VSRNAHAAIGPALLRCTSLLERRGLTAPPPALSGAASATGSGGSADALTSPRASWTTPAPALTPAAASPLQMGAAAGAAAAVAATAGADGGEPPETTADSTLALLPPPGSSAAMEARLQRRWRALVAELLDDPGVRADAADEFSSLLLALSPSSASSAGAAAAVRAAARGGSGAGGAAGGGAADQPDAHSVLRLLLRHASVQLDDLHLSSAPESSDASGGGGGGGGGGGDDDDAARRVGGGAAAGAGSAGAGAGARESAEAPGEPGRAAREASLARVLQLLHTLPAARDAPRLRASLVATLVEEGAVRLVLRIVRFASLCGAAFEQAGSRHGVVRQKQGYTSR